MYNIYIYVYVYLYVNIHVHIHMYAILCLYMISIEFMFIRISPGLDGEFNKRGESVEHLPSGDLTNLWKITIFNG